MTQSFHPGFSGPSKSPSAVTFVLASFNGLLFEKLSIASSPHFTVSGTAFGGRFSLGMIFYLALFLHNLAHL